MDLQTAEKIVAKQKETDTQVEAAQEVVRRQRVREAEERAKAKAEARAERETAGRQAVVEWLDNCVAGADKLRAEHSAAFERALATGAVAYLTEGGTVRLPLRLAMDGLAHAAEALRRRLEALPED